MDPVSVQNASTEPTTVIVIPAPEVVSRDASEAVLDERERFLRGHGFELVDDGGDRVVAGDETEHAHDHEQQGWDGEECVVGERGSEVRDVVFQRLLTGPDHDREPVALRKVGRRRVSEPRLSALGLRPGGSVRLALRVRQLGH